MSKRDQPPRRPHQSPSTEADKNARAARLAEAMRANLQRRKAQQQAQRAHTKTAPVKPT